MTKKLPEINLSLKITCGSDFQQQVFLGILTSFLMALKGMESSHKKNNIYWEYDTATPRIRVCEHLKDEQGMA